MGTVVLNGATSGSTTLTPTDAVTATLTLPSSTGTLISTSSSGQVIPSLALPAGTILQVVNATFTTQVTTSSTSFVTTGHSVTITPKSSTSKILVMASTVFGNAGSYNTALTFYRNGTTNLASGGATPCLMDGRVITGNFWGVGGSFSFLDSPATTSATTYAVYYLSDTSGVAYYNASPGVPSNTLSTIYAIEVAA